MQGTFADECLKEGTLPSQALKHRILSNRNEFDTKSEVTL